MALGASSGRIGVEVLREGFVLRWWGRPWVREWRRCSPVALVSCFLPAWRASREDAAVALRAD